jgi:hypothetical protein
MRESIQSVTSAIIIALALGAMGLMAKHASEAPVCWAFR